VREKTAAKATNENTIDQGARQAFASVDTSFMNAPFPEKLSDIDLAIIGIPFDLGTSYRPGARFGPRALRDLSVYMGLYTWGRKWPHDYDINQACKTRDFGDVRCPPGQPEKMVKNAETMASLILSADASILMLGGDHFTTLPLLRAYSKKYGTLSLVHFDAHTDDVVSEESHHGAQFYRGKKEGLIDPTSSVHVGIRSAYNRESSEGYNILDAIFVNEHTAAEIGDEIRETVGDNPVYLSFDIDFIDPAFAPGTGTPEIAGPDTFKSRAVLWSIEGLNVVGGDVVEVSPPYDNSGQITALAGATIGLDILYLLGTARKRLQH
jgi:agmatinase